MICFKKGVIVCLFKLCNLTINLPGKPVDWQLMYASILFDNLNIIVILCAIYLCLIKIHTYITYR